MDCRVMFAFFALLAGAANAFEVDFNESTFTSGIPAGWEQATKHSTTPTQFFANPQTVDGKNVLTMNFYSATAGSKIIYCSTPITDAACDNISVSIPIYLKKSQSGNKVDWIQAVASTNGFDTVIEIGDKIPLQELGRSEDGWVTNKISSYIEGISEHEILIGLKATAAGSSGKYGYVGGLKAEFVASATPDKTGFVVSGDGDNFIAAETLLPGMDDARVCVNLKVLPENSISSTNVYAIVARNGVVATNKLTYVGGTTYVGEPLMPTLDAGEELTVSVITEYTSYSLPVLGDLVDGIAYEHAENAWVGVVAKKGSVWINEAVLDEDGFVVEFAGTTNRAMTTGWTLSVSNETSETVLQIADVFDFTTNMINGVVGLEVWRFPVGALSDGMNVIKLINSRDVCESVVEVVNEGGSFSYGMSGIAVWNEVEKYGYDWSGTADGGVFTWESCENSTIGNVNEGQGFRVYFSTIVAISSKTSAGAPLPYATVSVIAENIENYAESTLFTTNVTTASDGTAELSFSGYSCTTDKVNVNCEATAFGWTTSGENSSFDVFLAEDASNEMNVIMSRAPASDDCDSLKSYWVQGSNPKWSVNTQGNRKALSLNLYNASVGTNSVLQCANSLSADGRKYASVSFEFRNTVNSNMSRYNELCFSFGTNSTWSGTVFDAVVLSNKRTEYANNEWYTYAAIVELPEGFESSELWLRLISRTKGGVSNTYIYLDNLRIAFQDVAMPTNLTRTVAAPVSGQSSAFALDVVPQTSDEVGEVSADLHLVLNGETNLVHFAFPNDGVYTNGLALTGGEEVAKTLTISADELSRQLGEAYGIGERPFLLGDTVTCFAAVRYNSGNCATTDDELYETRYYPDDSVVSNIDDRAYRIYETTTGYGPATNLLNMSAYNFTVTEGDAISKYGDEEATTEGVSFKLHAYDASGLGSLAVTINGVTYSVADDDGTHFPNFSAVDFSTEHPVRLTGVFQLASGLFANTQYTVTISGTRANGSALESASFSFITKAKAATKAPTVEKIVDFSEDVAKVSVSAPADYDPVTDDENSAATEYAIVVVTSNGATNTVTDAQDAIVWKTIADWKSSPVEIVSPTIDLEATNYFHFIARNSSGVEAVSGELVQSSVVFDMECAFVAATQVADPFGYVTYSINFMDAAQGENSEAAVEYTLDNGEWTTITNALAISFASGMKTSSGPLSWDAKSALGANYSGDHVFTIRAKVASGERVSEWATIEGALDFTKPSGLVFTAQPSAYENTASFSFTAKATDDKAITYWWSLNNAEPASGETTYDGSAVENQTNTVSVYAVDAMSNASDPIEYSWVVDVEKPSTPVVTDENSNGTYTKNVAFSFAATATDNLSGVDHYLWQHNNGAVTQKSSGVAFAGDATEGSNTITVKAVDKAGNVSDASSFSWIYDKTAPSAPVISGAPAASAKTASGFVSFAAAATDNLTAGEDIVYNWTLTRDGNPVLTDVTGVEFAQSLAEDGSVDGVYSASVVATDKAGNVGVASTRTWALDTTAPTEPQVSGLPGELTNEKEFTLTASGTTDAHGFTYNWIFGEETGTGETFGVVTVDDGAYEVKVYAVDAAGNSSATNTVSWTLDATAPTMPVVSGLPGELTNEKEFTLTAFGTTDLHGFTYNWIFGEATAGGETFEVTTVDDGDYEVKVYAVDAAGNSSATNTVSWTLDATPPTEPKATGLPGEVTNVKEFTLTASGTEDAHGFTYHWLFGTSDDGDYAVLVYAVDAVGNSSTTNTVGWTLDATKPTKPVVTGLPGALTNAKSFTLTASGSTDLHAFTYRWMFGGQAGEGETFNVVTAADGNYTVSVCAVDAAGNESEAATVSWTLDATAPTEPQVSGLPLDIRRRRCHWRVLRCGDLGRRRLRGPRLRGRRGGQLLDDERGRLDARHGCADGAAGHGTSRRAHEREGVHARGVRHY